MNVIKKNSIQFKLIVSFLVMILSTVFFFAIYSYLSESRHVRNEIIKRGFDVTMVFTQMTTPLLFSMDYIAILDNAKELVGSNDIISVMVMDKKGNTIVDTDAISSSAVEIGDFYRQLISGKTMKYRELSVGGETVLDFNKPVLIFEEVAGVVRIRISLKRMNEKLAQKNLSLGLITTGLIVLAFILAALLSRLFAPLAVLINGTKQIISGNLDCEMKTFSNDEIGELTHSFDQMRQHLKSGFIKLERRNETIRLLNESLEQRVEKRTAQLSTSNMKLLKEIEEREAVEDKLRRLRNYLGNIIDSMPSMLAGLDEEGRVTQWNREAENLTGIDAEKAEGRFLNDLFPQLPVNSDLIHEAVRLREVKKLSTVEITMKDSPRYFDVTLYPLDEQSSDGLVVKIDDVTDKKRAEELMAHSEKMLSVGGLAIGMAHEINNPLAGILQNIQVLANRLKDKLPANKRVADEAGVSMEAIEAYIRERGLFKTIEAIQSSGSRIARIVDSLSYFSRDYCPENRKENIIPIIEKAIKNVAEGDESKGPFNFSDIEIIREYEEEVVEIACKPPQIEQVLISVIRNGAQAMAAEKEEANVSKESRFIVRVSRESRMCRIEIEDNGPGVDEHVYKRIFEPFFTTKAVDVGSGLGLSVAYFIVTETHGGTMNVETQPGKGANFIFRLPYDFE